MPNDLEGFEAPHTLIEYRGIRGGERGERHPVKTPPRVRMPLRNLKTKKFDLDMSAMSAAAAIQHQDPQKALAEVKAIPVLLLSDEIMGEGGVVYIERALYSARGRLCSSPAGEEKAHQCVDVAVYAAGKGIRELPRPIDVVCNPDCPLWAEPGKKTDCKWRAITTVQLQSDPVFPSPVRHRTVSRYTIRAILTSLGFIRDTTGGVLMGIPLLFRQSHIDVKDAKNEFRRIPVMTFDFAGTVQDLRVAAVRELQSRNALDASHDGKLIETGDRRFVDYSHDNGTGESIVDIVEASEEDEVQPTQAADSDTTALIEVSSKVAMLYKKLGYPKARREALEAKHHGDLDAVLAELQSLSPDFNPSPGEPGADEFASLDEDSDLFV